MPDSAIQNGNDGDLQSDSFPPLPGAALGAVRLLGLCGGLGRLPVSDPSGSLRLVLARGEIQPVMPPNWDRHRRRTPALADLSRDCTFSSEPDVITEPVTAPQSPMGHRHRTRHCLASRP